MEYRGKHRNMRGRRRGGMTVLFAFVLAVAVLPVVTAGAATGISYTYTANADFDDGTQINVNHDVVADQLQLDSDQEAFNFIWVAASSRGTIVKIDTLTGAVLGEYLSSPEGQGRNPSRTTVDGNGNVWAGNRNESGSIGGVAHGSVVQIGLAENGQCIDRNGNGIIDTSTGLGNVLAWPTGTDGVGSTDGAGHIAEVQDAVDECILVYQRVPDAEAVRHVSVDANNDVWIGGYPFSQRSFHKLDNSTGAILNSFDARRFGCGGYGGLIDGNGVLWSASISQASLLRYDIGSDTGSCIPVSNSYGLGIDSTGHIWNSMYASNSIVKVSPAGVIQAGFPKPTGGASNDRGVAVSAADDNVWVANSGGSDVSRLLNNGSFVTTIAVGSNPTGVAVDAAGKVWATNLGSHSVSRINPSTNLVDLTVDLNTVKYNGLDAGPYNYSDMTGATLIAPPNAGTWTVVHDSGLLSAPWNLVSWNSAEPGDSEISVKVASSGDGITFGPEVAVPNGGPLTVSDGQYLKVIVTFERAGTGETPVLYDLTVSSNRPPVADPNGPYLFPLDAGPFDGSGSTDPDGDPLTFVWDFGDANSGTGAMPNHTYGEAGIYDVCLTVNDGYVDSEVACTTAVIYDPSGGFVTGGGWIDSPPGAYYPNLNTDFGSNVYELVYAGETWLYWDEAEAAAEQMTTDSCPAHLATVISEAEQAVITDLMGPLNLNAWIGGYQDPLETGTNVNWQWVTGETWSYTNWAGGEPNDNPWGIQTNGSEQNLEVYQGSGEWNDAPGTVDALLGGEGKHFYIVEYENCDPRPTGKATFGFVSKYKKGASVPTGSTEFQFHTVGLNFHSDSYDWLVVTGSNFAKFKGSGTIDGDIAPNGEMYKFQIWAGDNDTDTFRIKIWYEASFGEVVVYDNGMHQPIDAGSIVIHTKKK